jgi:hypothetical protein
MNTPKSPLKFWYEKNFLEIEFGIGVALGVGVALFFQCFVGTKLLTEALNLNRLYLYSTIAAICGSLLGFVITEASIIIVFGNTTQAKKLKDDGHLKTVFNINFQAINWLGVTGIWMIICLILDTDKSPRPWIFYVGVGLASISVLRIYRCVWVLKGITMQMCKKDKNESAIIAR